MITASLALLAIMGHQVPQPSLSWAQVGKNKHESISGLARWDTSGSKFVMVLDNKKAHDEQISWLTKSGATWKRTGLTISDPKGLANGELKDLEGVCKIPGRKDEVLAIGDKGSAQGWVYRFKLSDKEAALLDAFQVPGVGPDSDYEGIDIYAQGKKLVLAWGDRGGDNRPGTLWVAPLDLSKKPKPLGPSVSVSVKAPWPTKTEARSIADLRVADNGTVFVSAVSDPGDKGPFDSAIYAVARISANGNIVRLVGISPAKAICRITGRKVEAMEFDAAKRGFFFGTDDEDLGGWIASFRR